MVFEHIEHLKRQYTDKYVVVDDSRPELRRFRGYTGLVKTVNMSGRALVQFDEFEGNIGWFDIDVDFLKVVDRPPPKQEKPARAAPAKPTPADKPKAAKPAAAAAAPSGMSVQDVLAAARGGEGGATAAPKQPAAKEAAPKKETAAPAGQMSVADVLAAARGEKSAGAKAAPAKAEVKSKAEPSEAASSVKMDTPHAKDPSQMSVAEILAAARGEKGGAPAQSPAKPAPKAEPAAETTADEPADDESETESAPASQPAKTAVSELPTDTAGIIAWCRQHDSK